MPEFRNPKYNHLGTIDCEINHPKFGWIPHTIPEDNAELLAAALAANPAPYVPPTEAEQRSRTEAQITAIADQFVGGSDRVQALGMVLADLLKFVQPTLTTAQSRAQVRDRFIQHLRTIKGL